MAKLGSTPNAARYSGISVGPRFAYLFNTQGGIPVDGTDARLRALSPFILRFVPPDALLAYAQYHADQEVEELTAIAQADAALLASGNDAGRLAFAQSANDAAKAKQVAAMARDVGLINSAAIGADGLSASKAAALALSSVSAVGNLSNENIAQLESFVASGKVITSQQSGFISTLADAFTAADISLQLSKMLQVEPLQLLVNPTDMTVSHSKIQSYQQRGRYGYTFEAWGNELPTISISGSTAGFVAGSPDVEAGLQDQISKTSNVPTGYQEAARKDSAAWQNFMALYHYYRNNGYVYDTLGKSEAHLFIGSIAIEYDQFTYIGNIDSFSFSYTADSPHKVQFDMEFHVSKMYDNAKSSSTVGAMTSGPVNPSPQVDLSGTVSSQRQQNPVNVSTIPFDLLPR